MSNFTSGMDDNFTQLVAITTTGRSQDPPIDARAMLNFILMTYPEYRLAISINSYAYLTEVVVGSVANLLTLVVMVGLIHLPICNYMAALAVADLFVLLGPCLLKWLQTIDVDPRPSNIVVCRLLNFLTYWSFSFSAWILVAMTIDRYVAISFPLRALRLSTPRRARIVVGILMVVMALVNSHFLIILHIERRPGIQDSMCVSYDQFQHFLNDVWPWIDATVYSFVPFSFLIVFNFLIIRSHRRSIAVSSSMKGSKSGEIPVANAYMKITITLVVVALTFIAMTAPSVILHIIRPIVFNFKPSPNKTDYKILAQYTLATSLVNVLLYGNHCINLFLYVLTGRKFREQLVNTLRCWAQRRLRRIRSAPVNFSSTETNSSSLRNSQSKEDFQLHNQISSDSTIMSEPRVSLTTEPAPMYSGAFRLPECGK